MWLWWHRGQFLALERGEGKILDEIARFAFDAKRAKSGV